MGSWVFIGGVLNLLHAAYYPVLVALLTLGIFLFGLSARRHPHQMQAALTHPRAAVYLLLFLLSVALAAAIYPYYYSLNFIDDLRIYLPRIAWELQLGSAGGDPFSGAGLDSLGAQSLLQSFAAGLGASQYVVLFDYAFCFLVALGLCVELHLLLNLRHYWPALFVFLIVNPQLVNISAVYSTALFGLAVTAALYLLAQEIDRGTPLGYRRLLPAALLFSAFVGLKLTVVPFAACLCGTFLLWIIVNAGKPALLTSLKFCSLVILCLAPWLLLYTDKYLLALTASAATSPEAEGYLNAPHLLASLRNMSMLLRADYHMAYGGVPLSYTLCLPALAFAGFLAIKQSRSYRQVLGALIVSYSAAYLLYPIVFFDINHELRYLSPLLLIVLPLAIGIMLQELPGLRGQAPVRFLIAVATFVILVFPAADFLQVLAQRIDRIFHYKTYLSYDYAKREASRTSLRYLLLDKTRIQAIQGHVEKGAGVLAWLDTPFYLDYSRNTIFNFNPAGDLTPWIDIPVGAESSRFRDYLLRKDIRYVMWNYQGITVLSDHQLEAGARSPDYPIRRVSHYELYMRQILAKLREQSVVLLDDGQTVVFKI